MDRSLRVEALLWAWLQGWAVLVWLAPAWSLDVVTRFVVSLDSYRILALVLVSLVAAGWVNLHSADEPSERDPSTFWLVRYGAALRSGASARYLDSGSLKWLLRLVGIAALALSAVLLGFHATFTQPAADQDGDGIVDSRDDCPRDPEVFQGFKDEDGCPDHPDTDGDGVTDEADACVLEPEDYDHRQDSDGCPEPDNDLDGLLDEQDKCPDEAEDLDGYQDGDGCPDDDNDGDSVPDVADDCPNEVGAAASRGCPQAPLAVLTEGEICIGQQVFFEFDKATLKRESHAVLDAVREVLRLNPLVTLEVQGHTDRHERVPGHNQDLSERRARAVVDYLSHVSPDAKPGGSRLGEAIEPRRLVAAGYGALVPRVGRTPDETDQLSRRVQFKRTDEQARVTGEGCKAP